MAKRSEIEKALDELISEEAGMKFQGLAVVLAKQKWPRLVASERKWDLGLDAHANGELEPDGRGMGLASSLTGTYKKIASDAAKARKHYPDVGVLIFATAEGVTNHTKREWAQEIRKNFDFELIVVSREDLVTSLLDPANSSICIAQLGIPVEVKPELKPVLERARDAAAEVVASWEQRPRLAGRPQIDLDAERIEEGRETRESLTVESLRKSLAEGRRLILEAPAGRGKTTTLVQIAKRAAGAGDLAFLVDLPAWAKSGKEILQFIAERPQFVSRGLDANALSSLRGSEPFSFLLNGWNEVSEGTAEAAVHALRDLELNYPAAGIIVATRTHHIRPPLPGAFRARLLPLRRRQRDEYLNLALGKSANELRVKLNNSRTLDELTRTPLILAEVTELFRKGNPIPTTKMGILGAVMRVLEESEEHHAFLQQAPLGGYAAEYLGALSMEMTERGEVEISEADARAIVNSVSGMLQKNGQIGALPEPMAVLHELSNHHVLERLEYAGIAFRFEHQQFQEFFAARRLKGLLLGLVRGRNANEDRKFLIQYVNEPRWGESLRMLAEDIGAETGAPGADEAMVEAGAKLVRTALNLDPIFCAELAAACGSAVWSEVRQEVGARLRALYGQADANHRQCALAAMLATGADDFQDILVGLLADANEQVRLPVYHGGAELAPSSLGPNWRDIVRGWPEGARLDFVLQLARDPWLADTVEGLALADPSPKIKWQAAQMLSWYGFTEKVEALLGPLDEASFRDALRTMHQEEIPSSLRPRVVAAYEKMYSEASDPFERLRILRLIERFGGANVIERTKAELQGLDENQLKAGNEGGTQWALEELRKSDPKWVSEWLAEKILDKSIRSGGWNGLITSMPEDERESLFARFSNEALDEGEKQRALSLLAATADGALAARAFARACEIRRDLSNAPGQDLPKWSLLRQVEDLLRAIGPRVFLAGIIDKLEKEPETTELGVLTEVLGTFNPVKTDVRTSVAEDVRQKLRSYLKRAVERAAETNGVNASVRAHLAVLLAQVGEPEDMDDVRRLIEADVNRFREVQAARLKGDRSGDAMGYIYFYIGAATAVDPNRAEDVLLELLKLPEYERVVAETLPRRARKSESQPGLENTRMDFARIWNARAGKPDDFFAEDRRSRYADAFRDAITAVQKQREGASDKRSFDYRLKILGGALAALDAKRSAKLVLEVMELPGRWDGWTRVGALENLLVAGVPLTREEVMKILGPTMEELQASGLYNDNQNLWLLQRCLCVLAFVDPPSAGIAKMREILAGLRFPPYESGGVVAALGASRCEEAMTLLMELAGADGGGVQLIGEPWIKAVAALGGKRSREVLLSFVDPNASVFTKDFVPDHQHGDLLARLLAERAEQDEEFKAELFRLGNGDLPAAKRTLLAKVFARFQKQEDLVTGLSVMRDDGQGVPYELVRSIENVFLERRPYGTASNTYTLAPLGCNAVRKRLFEMALRDPDRKRSASALLGQIEVWRLEHGRPADEPRHPAVESGEPWPPLLA